jgi:hypothetical protein
MSSGGRDYQAFEKGRGRNFKKYEGHDKRAKKNGFAGNTRKTVV